MDQSHINCKVLIQSLKRIINISLLRKGLTLIDHCTTEDQGETVDGIAEDDNEDEDDVVEDDIDDGVMENDEDADESQ